MFSDVVQSICQAYTVQREACPLAETLVITSESQLAQSDEDPPIPSLQSTVLKNVDWAKTQARIFADKILKTVIYYCIMITVKEKNELSRESPEVLKYRWEWKKLDFVGPVCTEILSLMASKLNS